MSGSAARANPASNRDSGLSASCDQGRDGLPIAERARRGDRAVADVDRRIGQEGTHGPGHIVARRLVLVLDDRDQRIDRGRPHRGGRALERRQQRLDRRGVLEPPQSGDHSRLAAPRSASSGPADRPGPSTAFFEPIISTASSAASRTGSGACGSRSAAVREVERVAYRPACPAPGRSRVLTPGSCSSGIGLRSNGARIVGRRSRPGPRRPRFGSGATGPPVSSRIVAMHARRAVPGDRPGRRFAAGPAASPTICRPRAAPCDRPRPDTRVP